MQMIVISRAEDKELPINNNMYMADADFDTISALTAERSDIGMAVSSTPTGHRSRFWQLCTNEKLGLKI